MINSYTGITTYTGNTTNGFTYPGYTNPLWTYGLMPSTPSRENELIPETAEAWLRRRVQETCDASGLALD